MRVFLLALALALPASAQRVGEVGFTVDQWGGIDNLHDSSRISDFDAQSAENVLTDSGRLEKREGNVRLTTILAGYPNKAVREFVPGSQTRYLIAHASDTVYQTDLSGTVTALSTATSGANVDMIQALNTLIVQDGQRVPWTWDAASTTSVSGMPTCKFLEYANERVYCGNIPSQSSSRVAVSSYGSVTYFTVPANVSAVAEAPNTFDFQREDGDQITCMKATRCGIFVGKSKSTHILKGYDNFTFRKDVISENIGCQDDRTVQTVDGDIVWLGQDAIYKWSCAGKPEPISREIDSTVKSLRQGNSFSVNWVLNTQADFEGGFLTPSGSGAPMSSTIESGSIVASTFAFIDTSSTNFSAGSNSGTSFTQSTGSVILSSGTMRDNFSDSDYTSGATTWTTRGGGFAVTTYLGAKYLQSTSGIGNLYNNIYTTYNPQSTGYWTFKHAWSTNSGSNCSDSTQSSGNRSNGAYCFDFRFVQFSNNTFYTIRASDDNGFATKVVEIIKSVSGVETVLTNRAVTLTADVARTFEINRSTLGVITLAIDGVFISSTVDTAIVYSSRTEIAATYEIGPNMSNLFTDIYSYHYNSTGTYTSGIFDTGFSTPIWGAISSTFTAYNAQSEGNIAFYVQSSTANDGGGFSSLVSSSDTLTLSSLPSRRYLRYVLDFTTAVSTKTPSLDAISIAANTSGYYNSPVKFVGIGISTFGAFDALETLPSGSSISYQARVTTYSFVSTNTSIAWTNITNHATVPITVSTPTYFQYRALLTPNQGDQIVSLDRSQLSWTEGLVSPPAASGWKDGRYFLCGTISTSATYPDTCLVWQRNKKWVTFTGFSAASMTTFNRDLIAGSGGTDGYVWKMLQDAVYNDDGAAITATWISKDFMYAPNGRDWPTGHKVLNELWVDADVSSSTYLTASFSIDKSTTYLSGTVDLGAWGDSVNKMVPFTTNGRGKYTRFKFVNSDYDKSLGLNGYSVYGEPQPKDSD